MDNIRTVNSSINTSFDKGLGYSLLNGAMWSAPYDTGNLASSIQIPVNMKRLIVIKVSGKDAPYGSILDRDPKYNNFGWWSINYRDYILGLVERYFTEGNIPTSNSFSWSKAFYTLTQAKGIGTQGHMGSRHLVGRSRHNPMVNRHAKRKMHNRNYNKGYGVR